MECKLRGEVLEGKETVGGKKAPLVLTVTTLDLAVVSGRVWSDELMPDAQTQCGSLKQGGQVPLGIGEAVGELKAIVGLDTLHGDAPSFEPIDSTIQEISGGVGRLLLVGPEEAQA